MQTAPLAVIGDALIDELRDASGTREFVGGAALNVAVGLARLKVPTALIAMVGEDADGERIRALLDEHGVELISTRGPYGTARAISDRLDGEPTYIFSEAAQRRRIEFDERARDVIAAAPFTVVSCFPFDDPAQVDALAASVPADSRRLIVDPNPREGMLHSRERFVAGFERIARLSRVVKVGDDDARLLYGTDLEELVERLTHFVPHVVATAGRDGAVVHSAGERVHRPIAELPGAIIDTMGAGDAVLAAITAHIASAGEPTDATAWGRALERAMTIAAATCRSEGALLREP